MAISKNNTSYLALAPNDVDKFNDCIVYLRQLEDMIYRGNDTTMMLFLPDIARKRLFLYDLHPDNGLYRIEILSDIERYEKRKAEIVANRF